MDQPALAEQLDALGHPLTVSTISRLETGDRRADVSDLFALAIALNVTPNRLCLPDEPSDPRDQDGPARAVDIAERYTVSWEHAWEWAAGESPLSLEVTYLDTPVDTPGRGVGWQELLLRWRAENAPHRLIAEDLRAEEMMSHLSEFARLRDEVRQLEDRVPPDVLQRFLGMLARETAARAMHSEPHHVVPRQPDRDHAGR